MDAPTHWHIGPDGMHVYSGGRLVAVIPVAAFAGVIADMAGVLASVSQTDPKRRE